MTKKVLTICLCLVMFASVCFGANVVMQRAKKHMPLVTQVLNDLWPKMPRKEVIPAQIEQESGFKPTATLKTSRELGRGFAQITIAYGKDGQERFNNYRNAVRLKQLKNWNWKEDPYNEKYQLTYLILMDKSNYTTIRPHMISDDEALKTMLVSHNAGAGRWVIRRTYAKSKGIPADRWTGGLDRACKPAEINTVIYGMSLCDMVNHYPATIMKKAPKYKSFFPEGPNESTKGVSSVGK